MSVYSAIASEAVRQHVRQRQRVLMMRTDERLTIFKPVDEEEDSEGQATADELPDDDEPVWHRPDVCNVCGGRIYALQNCLKCFPVVELGSKTRAEAMQPDTQRKLMARADGRRFYKSMTPCKSCSDSEPTRHCVGDHCVVCTAAAAARGEYDDVVTLPAVVVVKPKRVRTYAPKLVAPVAPKPAPALKPPGDRHQPKSAEHRAAIAAAAWRRYHPESSSHEPVTSWVERNLL